MIDLSIWVVLALLFAAFLATLLRFWDFPTNTLGAVDIKTALATFIGALIAAFFALWLKALDPTVPADFIIVTMAAIGGMGGVRGLFEVAKRLTAPKKV